MQKTERVICRSLSVAMIWTSVQVLSNDPDRMSLLGALLENN